MEHKYKVGDKVHIISKEKYDKLPECPVPSNYKDFGIGSTIKRYFGKELTVFTAPKWGNVPVYQFFDIPYGWAYWLIEDKKEQLEFDFEG